MSAILDQVLGRLKAREAAAIPSYEDLVGLIVAGDDPGEERTLQVLTAAGKQHEDLAASVALLEQRRADADLMASIRRLDNQAAEAAEVARRARKAHADAINAADAALVSALAPGDGA